jgi:uncharacterized protein YfkK (UPF0435 family)
MELAVFVGSFAMRTKCERAAGESSGISSGGEGTRVRLSNGHVVLAATALLACIFGFAYGNLFDAQYGFHLKEWQALVGAIITLIGIVLGFLGVRGSQRLNIISREEDRIEELTPGLQQTCDVLTVLTQQLRAVRRQSLYNIRPVLRSYFNPSQGEAYAAMVRRKIPLANAALQREATGIVSLLMMCADVLEATKNELDRVNNDVRHIEEFDVGQHEEVRNIANTVAAKMKNSTQEMLMYIDSLQRLAVSMSHRIANLEHRRFIIRREIDRYFVRIFSEARRVNSKHNSPTFPLDLPEGT